jgi:uncharacterized protein CbrC (UPF0167 family)
MTTFADLGITFPLFEAPTGEASGYSGTATCRCCGGQDRHCFKLGIGDAMILPCPSCGTENGLDVDDQVDVPCRSCGITIAFPESMKDKEHALICYDCLRAGKAAMTKDTEFGMVSWDHAFRGITHGLPGLRSDQFEVVPIDPDEDWNGVRIPSEHLWELLRTPDFCSWQGETWLFCCRRPMTYLGGWSAVLESLRPADPEAFFDGLFESDDQARHWGPKAFESVSPSLYIHRCRTCNRCRATWDCD